MLMTLAGGGITIRRMRKRKRERARERERVQNIIHSLGKSEKHAQTGDELHISKVKKAREEGWWLRS